MKGFANDDHELAAALTMLEIKGGAFCFVDYGAGSSFKTGYYHVFYRGAVKGAVPGTHIPQQPKQAMIRKASEVYAILENMENGTPQS